MDNREIFSKNNFDLLRLFAAFQVATHHTLSHLNISYDESGMFALLDAIPGVPIFFFISGYLISKSYENNSNLFEYSQNRLLRIYPALFVCVLLSLLSVYLSGYFEYTHVPVKDFTFWIIGQLSFYQFYNPEFMRAYGIGVLNGSLWTISVELQFYILTPALYVFILRITKYPNSALMLLIIIFLVLNRFYFSYRDDLEDQLFYKLVGVSFVPWFYMFLSGVFVQRNFNFFYKFLGSKYIAAFLLFGGYMYVLNNVFTIKLGNAIGPLVFFPLVIVLFSAAYSSVYLSKKLLKKHDISYGLYIYHMPVINALVFYGYSEELHSYYIAIAITLVISFLSWRLLEYPSLKLKRHPLNPLNKINVSRKS